MMCLTLQRRRLLAVLLAFVLLAAACGGDDAGDDAGTDDAAADDGDTPADDGDDTPADDGDTPADDGDDGDDTPADDGDDGDDTPADDGDDTPADDGDDGDEPIGPPEPTNGFDGETITLGYLTAETGTLAAVGTGLLAGSQVFWDWVNSEGGIAGQYPVELAVGDTQDIASVTTEEYRRLKDDVVMFAQVLSTPPTQALLEFLEEDGIIAVPGSLAGQWANEPLLLPNGTSYQSEMINLADWYLNESGLAADDDVFCVVRTNDKYGEDSLDGLEFAADQLGFELAEEQTHARGDQNFTAQISAFEGADCDVVFAIAVTFEMNGILNEASAQGFEPIWLGALPSYLNFVAAGSPELYENFYVALDTPNFTDDDVPGMAKFNARWEEFNGGTPNTFNLSGYFQSIAIKALLEEAVARGDLGREGLQDALANLGEVDLEGLADNYVYGTPENRIPARAVRIYKFDNDAPPNRLTQVAQIESEITADYQP